MFPNVIAHKKGTEEWLVCRVEGREPSARLTELVKDPDYLMELESEYFIYYKLRKL